MKLPTGIRIRNRIAYVWVKVPLDVAAVTRTKQVRESLKTSDINEARRRGLKRLAELEDEWQAIRDRRLTDDDLRRIANRVYAKGLKADEHDRVHYLDAREIAALESEGLLDEDVTNLPLIRAAAAPVIDATNRKAELAALRSGLRKGNHDALVSLGDEIDAQARDGIKQEELAIDEGSTEFRRVRDAVTRARIQVLERAIERDAGRFDGAPADPIVVDPGPKEPSERTKTVMALFDMFATHNDKGNSADTITYSRQAIESFVGVMPKSMLARQITKARIVEWTDLLRRTPIRWTKVRDYEGMTLRQIVEHNEALPQEKRRPALSPASRNKFVSSMQAYCGWLIARGELQGDNPADDQYVTTEKGQVRPYTTGELNALFKSPLFTGYLSDEKDWLPGNIKTRDHRFWLPLISLFSGARLGEICQLQTADVRQEEGRWIMFITTEGNDKRLKTDNSQRLVPLHDELIKLGFPAFHAEMSRRGARLFPEIKKDTRGMWSGYASTWFRRYMERSKLKAGKETNFHSFRHSLIDACRSAGFLDDEFAFLVGHVKQEAKTTRLYGRIPQGTVQRRTRIIDAVVYEGLDLSHLYV